MLKLKGKIFEVGNLEDGSGRGVRLEHEGEDFAITGLTEDECRSVTKLYGQEVEVTISALAGA